MLAWDRYQFCFEGMVILFRDLIFLLEFDLNAHRLLMANLVLFMLRDQLQILENRLNFLGEKKIFRYVYGEQRKVITDFIIIHVAVTDLISVG